MFITQPVPLTVEDLRQEVNQESLLDILEQQQAAQEQAIRNYKADTRVVGAALPTQAESEDETEEESGSGADSTFQSAGEDEADE